jgi:hypothetical protein
MRFLPDALDSALRNSCNCTVRNLKATAERVLISKARKRRVQVRVLLGLPCEAGRCGLKKVPRVFDGLRTPDHGDLDYISKRGLQRPSLAQPEPRIGVAVLVSKL